MTVKDFYQTISNSETLVVATFGAEWSGNADMLRNILVDVCEQYDPNVEFIWTDVDAEAVIANEWGIQEIPTTLIFQNGSVVDHFTGLLSRNKVRQRIDSLL